MINNTSFRSILLNCATSELGGALLTACNAILVFKLTGSPTALGTVWLLYYIPSFFMQLFIGPYIDRWSRKWIMICCQLIRMLLAISMLALLFSGNFSIAIIYIIQSLIGVIMPVFTPANQAILPTILKKEHLAKANASLDSVRQIMMIIGPLIAGVFVDFLAIEWVLLFAGLSFAWSAIILLSIQENYSRIHIREPWIREFREGLQSYFQHKLIVWLGVFFGFVQFGVGVTLVTTLPYIHDVLDKPYYSAYAMFLACFPIGYTIGAFINDRLINAKGIGILFATLFIGGLTYISLGITPWYVLALGTELLAGMVIAIFNIYNVTLIQKTIPNQLMGKVTSVRLLIMRTMLPLGVVFAMQSVTFFSIRTLYLVIGTVICVTSIIGYFILKNRESLTTTKEKSLIKEG